ncbi:MAG: hypothetical protein HY784_09805 [Chloroflexi bacterium]|nr:hypothetical protein [Chloroflexota bacterium]
MPTGLMLFLIAGALLSLGIVGYAVMLIFRGRRQEQAAAPEAPAPAEVARLLRDPRTEGLIVEMDGRQYRQDGDIPDRAASLRLATAAGELLTWLGAAVPSPGQGPAPTPDPVPGQGPAPAPARGTAPPPRVEAATAAPGPNPIPCESPPALQMPSMKPLEQLRILRERARRPPPPAPRSVVEQIDAVLQEQLAGGELAGRSIQLLGRSDGAVLVVVGEQVFEGVEGVPYPEIRAAIRQAVERWEARRAPAPDCNTRGPA